MTTGATIDDRTEEHAERLADDPLARAVAVLRSHFGSLEEMADDG